MKHVEKTYKQYEEGRRVLLSRFVFKSELCLSLAVSSWASYLTSLSFISLIYEIIISISLDCCENERKQHI